ncbi:MAG: DUF192 domain-containing protein [Acidimicrobiales bacterium]
MRENQVAWLLRGGDVLASLDLARSWRDRAIGLMGRRSYEGGMLIEPCRSVQTIGVRFPLDVAFLDEHRVVIAMTRMAPNRIGMPRRTARSVLEAKAGAFERWNLALGDTLEVKE